MNINLDHYIGKLQRTLQGHVADLAVVLRSLEDATYQDKVAIVDKTRPHISHDGLSTAHDSAADRQTSKCFASLVDDFLVYVDEMTALKELIGSGTLTVSKDLVGQRSLQEYFESYLQEKIDIVHRDQGLSAPQKIDALGLDELPARYAKQYVSLRNCIAHHDRRARSELVLEYATLKILVDGKDLPPLPCIVEKGQKLEVGHRPVRRAFSKNERIFFSEDECKHVSLTLEQLARNIAHLVYKGLDASHA